MKLFLKVSKYNGYAGIVWVADHARQGLAAVNMAGVLMTTDDETTFRRMVECQTENYDNKWLMDEYMVKDLVASRHPYYVVKPPAVVRDRYPGQCRVVCANTGTETSALETVDMAYKVIDAGLRGELKGSFGIDNRPYLKMHPTGGALR